MNVTQSTSTTQRGRRFRRILFLFEFVVCFSGLVFAPLADALQLQIQQDLVMRTTDGGSIAPQGLLKAGSVIDVPTQYKVMSGNQVDVNGTLQNWLKKTGYQHTNNPGLSNREDSKDFFFPVHVVKSAYGSYMTKEVNGVRQNAEFTNEEYFVPLRHLSKYGKLLVVNADSPVYSWNGRAPLQTLESRRLMENADAAVANCNCDINGQALGRQTQGEITDASRILSQAGRQAPTRRSETAVPHTSQPPAARGYPISGLAPACSNFIDRDGNYGPYGEMVLDEINRYPIYFEDANRVSRICPKFNTFSDEKKNQFWVWVYASLAHQESGCNPNVKSNPRHVYNPNGIAVGLFQMELRSDLRARRDRAFGGSFCSGNPFDPQTNIRCSARIMAWQLENGGGLYSYSPQYWGPFKSRNVGSAKRSISRYAGCF